MAASEHLLTASKLGFQGTIRPACECVDVQQQSRALSVHAQHLRMKNVRPSQNP